MGTVYDRCGKGIQARDQLHWQWTSAHLSLYDRQGACRHHGDGGCLALSLLDKGLVTDQIVLYVGYDRENVTKSGYNGDLHIDHYGRFVPKPAHGSINLDALTSSANKIRTATVELFNSIVNPNLLVRRLNITANHVVSSNIRSHKPPVQLDLFTDYDEIRRSEQQQKEDLDREHRVHETILELKKRFGKNSILKGTNFAEGATGKDRNAQIGGHKA